MIRCKDQTKSLAFYQEIMGMKLLRTSENKDAGFNLYFLGYPAGKPESQSSAEGLLELTWNYGTESQADFKYHDGNAEPQGFGHICGFFFSFLFWL
jgi:lactoylglutathione lyase